jgi:hypothetical protein
MRWLNLPERFAANRRLQIVAALVVVMAVSLVLGVVSIKILLPVILKQIDWSRSLFPWDPMPKIPKVVTLIGYIGFLCFGLLIYAAIIRVLNASDTGVAKVHSKIRGWGESLGRPRKNFASALLLLGSLPLAWALFVTSFQVPNEFLALPTQRIVAGKAVQTNLEFIASRQLEGFQIPEPGRTPQAPLLLELVNSRGAYQAARELVLQFPEFYWFDERSGRFEIHRIGNTSQYQRLLSISSPDGRPSLQRQYHSDMGDALALASRQYTTEEKQFMKLSRPELERALVLGRFYYHHSFIFSAAVAKAHDPEYEHGSQYGKGLTQGFAAVLATIPEQLQFNAYLLLLYASYPLYFLLIIAVARGCGLEGWQRYFVAATTIVSFLLSEIETVRLGVGLAPWRHIFDVMVLYALWRYARRISLENWMLLAVTTFASIYWSREMGLFIGLSALGALVALAIQQRVVRGLWAVMGLALAIVFAWLLSDPHAQSLSWTVLMGFNTPKLPWGFLAMMVVIVVAMLFAWLWLTPRVGSKGNVMGWWSLVGAVVLYTAASGIYIIFYPRPHHFAPVLPSIALGTAAGWALLTRSERALSTLPKIRLLASGTTMALFLALGGLGVLRSFEVMGESRIFSNHVVHRWDFPAARLKSTGNPEMLLKSVAMIRAHATYAAVDILSPWEVVLLPLSGKGKNGPFVVSFDSLLTEREVGLLARHLVRDGKDVLFVDTRLALGQYELPLLEDAYMGDYLRATKSRAQAHTMLRIVFSRVQNCYRLEEVGPLISAYRRVTQNCQTEGKSQQNWADG